MVLKDPVYGVWLEWRVYEGVLQFRLTATGLPSNWAPFPYAAEPRWATLEREVLWAVLRSAA